MRIVILHKQVYEFLLKNGIDCNYDAEKDEINIYITLEDFKYELYMKFPLYYPYEFPELYINNTNGLMIPHMRSPWNLQAIGFNYPLTASRFFP